MAGGKRRIIRQTFTPSISFAPPLGIFRSANKVPISCESLLPSSRWLQASQVGHSRVTRVHRDFLLRFVSRTKRARGREGRGPCVKKKSGGKKKGNFVSGLVSLICPFFAFHCPFSAQQPFLSFCVWYLSFGFSDFNGRIRKLMHPLFFAPVVPF